MICRMMCDSVCRHLEGILDDKGAILVAKYLASSRALSRSFDVYLQQVPSFPAAHCL